MIHFFFMAMSLVFALGILLLSDIRFWNSRWSFSSDHCFSPFEFGSFPFFSNAIPVPSLKSRSFVHWLSMDFHPSNSYAALYYFLKTWTRSAIVSIFFCFFVPLLIVSSSFFVSAYFEKSFLKRQRKKIFFVDWRWRFTDCAYYGVSVGLESRTTCRIFELYSGDTGRITLFHSKKIHDKVVYSFGPMLATATFLCLLGEEMLTLYLSLVWKGAL